jgi:DNA mismatch repair protein MutS
VALEARTQGTGIASLKIRYNRVSGYGIEVTKPNLALVPADYIRKQTLAGAERFVTVELKEQEQKLLGAETRVGQLEAALFAELVAEAATHQRALTENARALAVLDTLTALADLAHDRGYVRPVLDRGDAIVIRDGRHPVIETTSAAPPSCRTTAPRRQPAAAPITGPTWRASRPTSARSR